MLLIMLVGVEGGGGRRRRWRRRGRQGVGWSASPWKGGRSPAQAMSPGITALYLVSHSLKRSLCTFPENLNCKGVPICEEPALHMSRAVWSSM